MTRTWLHVGLPLITGSSIYALWRSPALLGFEWLEAVGASRSVLQLRAAGDAAGHVLPSWIVFSLPNGLWSYALMASIGLLWRTERWTNAKQFWFWCTLCIAVLPEVGQAMHLIPGTFDLVDLVNCLVGSSVAVGLVWPCRSREIRCAR